MSETIPELAERLAAVRDTLYEIKARLEGEAEHMTAACRRLEACPACTSARAWASAMNATLEYLERICAFRLVPYAERFATRREIRAMPGTTHVRILKPRV